MGFLGLPLTIVALLLPASAWAAFEPDPNPLHGYEITTDNSAGAGQFSLGISTEIRLGNEDDFLNQTGSVRGSYTQQISRETPGDNSSPLLRESNWTGGITLVPWTDGNVGVDLDSSSDNTDGLFTNGVKFETGWKFLNINYRFAKSEIQQGFDIANKKKITDFQGAFIYQSQFGGDITLPIGTTDGFLFSGSYSFFNPDASGFANLLTKTIYTSLEPLQNTLQSFEVWDFRTVWKHYFPNHFDSTVDIRYAHLVFPVNPHWDLALSGGYDVTHSFHVELGTEYSHDSASHELLGRVALRYSWDRN